MVQTDQDLAGAPFSPPPDGITRIVECRPVFEGVPVFAVTRKPRLWFVR
jgi:hypothetical protein